MKVKSDYDRGMCYWLQTKKSTHLCPFWGISTAETVGFDFASRSTSLARTSHHLAMLAAARIWLRRSIPSGLSEMIKKTDGTKIIKISKNLSDNNFY